jgi:hypothetical protein
MCSLSPLPQGPLPQGRRLLPGAAVPAVVPMPEAEPPAVQTPQTQQQAHQSHGILTTRNGHQQRRPRRQQLGLSQQVTMQAQVIRAPGSIGGWNFGWENHGRDGSTWWITSRQPRSSSGIISPACLCHRCHPSLAFHPLTPMSHHLNVRHAGLPQSLRQALERRKLLKVIAGLTNREETSVLRIARAASAGGADLIDVACEPSLVRQVASTCPELPICVSAVDPELFPGACRRRSGHGGDRQLRHLLPPGAHLRRR